MQTQCRCKFVFDDEGKDIQTEMQTYSNGIQHKKALCPACGKRQERSLPQTEFCEILYFGKHKSRQISDVAKDDPAYLRWLLQSNQISSRLRISIETILHDVAKGD